jgi:WD40 repeat protein
MMIQDADPNPWALSRDGSLALSGGADHTARLWDVATGKGLQKLEGHTSQVYAVAFRPDGRQAPTGSEDTLLKLWYLRRLPD